MSISQGEVPGARPSARWSHSLRLGLVTAVSLSLLSGLAGGQELPVANSSSASAARDRQPLVEIADARVAIKRETLKALKQAKDIQEEVLRIDGDEEAYYTQGFVDEIVAFYQHGVGTAEDPGNPVVTRKFCREYVLALFNDLFSLGVKGEGESESEELAEVLEDASEDETEPRAPRHPLDHESAELLRDALCDLLPSAFHDLDFLQRRTLYRVAAKTFRPEDELAIAFLEVLAEEVEKAEPDTGENDLIKDAIALIAPASSP